MISKGRIAMTAAVLLATGPAIAGQPGTGPAGGAPSSTVSGVTVRAPDKPDPLLDRTTEFVRQRLPANRNDQYARFRDPVCVRVVGLPPAFDAFVANRIVAVAKQVRAPVEPSAACKPNVDVIFSAQPQAQLTDIARRRDILFGFYWKAQAKAVATFRGPVQSWDLTRTVGTDGKDMLELAESARCISSGAPGSAPCDILAPPVMGRAGSRLGNDMSSEIVHSLILADTAKVAGLKIDAVADYVAVLALSRWQALERCAGLPTILNLLAEGCDAEDRPEAATPGDLALLSGLYALNPRESGPQQRAAIASATRKANTNKGALQD